MEKIVITGAHGFIGSHLRKRLSSKFDVETPFRSFLYEPRLLKEYLERIQPTAIYHLAAYGNHYFQTEENLIFKANNQALLNLLEASKDIPYRAFLNFSTTHHNLEAGSFYGSTKAGGEYLVRAFVRNFNKPIINIRPYSIYGEREWDFRFIPTISRQIANDEKITVSDVDHDWTYVEDFIDGLLEARKDIKKLTGLSVGIGTGKRVSNLEVAKTLMKAVGKTVHIHSGVKRSYEIAAYGKEMLSNKDKDEVFLRVDKTPLEIGVKKVYDNPELWLSKNYKKES